MAQETYLKELNMICEYLNNWFWREKIAGTFDVTAGSIDVPSLKDGQYYRIIGSVFNEGIHIYPSSDLKAEEFKGEVWAMVIPEDIIALASDLHSWLAEYGTAGSEALSPYSSESFNGYSYSKNAGGGADASGAGANSWQNAFSYRLIPYRRLRGAT